MKRELKTPPASSDSEMLFHAGNCRPPRFRSLAEFAESEITIPSGPFDGLRFSLRRQPYVRLLYDAIDSGRWSRFVITGPSQSGKTLCGFVTPLLYHLFEMRERVVLGLPDMDMARDKWELDLLPVIERTRFRDQLPQSGYGSRGGTPSLIKFRNGAALKIMTGGGSDKGRAAFTTRVLCITETDGMDEAGERSREADKITQLIARLRSFKEEQRRIYLECTLTTEEGRTWQEFQAGTASKIFGKCPLCDKFVHPERQHLAGWQEAATGQDAAESSAYHCPDCGKPWSEDDRRLANLDSVLVHRGQEIDPATGTIAGEPVKGNTLGFRWTAANNLFSTAGDVGRDEWRAANARDQENAEKELRQFVWAMPYCPPKVDLSIIDDRVLARRQIGLSERILPEGTVFLTAALDVGQYAGHWACIAWSEAEGGEISGHIPEYGVLEMPASETPQVAVLQGLRRFRDEIIMPGWRTFDGKELIPSQVWIDARFLRDTVFAFCRESREGAQDRFRPSMGYGASQRDFPRMYHPPRTKSKAIIHVGENFHFVFDAAGGVTVAHVNADYWKTWLHKRLTLEDFGAPGSITLYETRHRHGHLSFAKHIASERLEEEFIPGKGNVQKWVKEGRNNHWLDACYNACAAAGFCAASFLARPADTGVQVRPKQEAGTGGFKTPDGRPFFVGERR